MKTMIRFLSLFVVLAMATQSRATTGSGRAAAGVLKGVAGQNKSLQKHNFSGEASFENSVNGMRAAHIIAGEGLVKKRSQSGNEKTTEMTTSRGTVTVTRGNGQQTLTTRDAAGKVTNTISLSKQTFSAKIEATSERGAESLTRTEVLSRGAVRGKTADSTRAGKIERKYSVDAEGNKIRE